jgi:hypothetical protein
MKAQTDLRNFLGSHAETVFPKDRHGPPPRDPRADLKAVLSKLYRYRMDALRLYLALPVAQEFHASSAKWRLTIGSNRAGKSLACGAEFARAVRGGLDPFDKYPHHNGNAIIVGSDSDHLGLMWRTIAEEGAFYLIQDEITRLWRAVRPHADDPTRLDDYDDAYREKWKPAPPLIPESCYAYPAWEDLAKGVPRVVNFTCSGWSSLWRTGNGHAQKGAHYNLGWLDEDQENDSFYEEINRGLVGLNEREAWLPKGIWSATPQADNPKLLELRDKADSGSDYIRAYFFSIGQNPYVSAAERRAFYESMSEEEREVRYYGRSASEGRRVYASLYDPQGLHGCEPNDVPEGCAYYLFLDPGTTRAACLFIAVDHHERHLWVVDGFAQRNCHIQQFVSEVAARAPEVMFESAVIDQQAGRASYGLGGENTTAAQWWKMLMRAGVKVNRHGTLEGSGFFPSNPDVAFRQNALQNMMLPREDGPYRGTPKLKVVRGIFPDLDKEIRNARMAKVKRTTRTMRSEKRRDLQKDALDCLEYAAAFNPPYREPIHVKTYEDEAVIRMFNRKKKKHPTNSCICMG